MRRDQAQIYRDQFEYLGDCFELIRKRGDAFNIRNEALETERMVRYSERSGFESERSHLLEIYRDIEEQIRLKQKAVSRNKVNAAAAGLRFPIDSFIERHGLSDPEIQILLILLYNESVGPSHARFQTGNEILNLLFPNPVSALRASEYLDPCSTLFKAGLIHAVSEDRPTNFLRTAYEVTEKTLTEVFGVRDRSRLAPVSDSQHAANSGERPYREVRPRVTLDQVILSPELKVRLDEVIWQIEHGDRLFREWGLGDVVEKGKGTIVLLSGPPGTGKTMTAEAVAERMGSTLFVADYSQLESKWIGDTEKNIVTVFRDAKEAGAVLLLDEADAILAARLDGGHYNDRAYNRQVSLLLTELENFEGVCLLTTNREVTLDTGLARRIGAQFTFEIPGPRERRRLWEHLLPAQLPVAGDLDLDVLAREFEMAGGSIKNAVVAAARRAARREGSSVRIRQADFLHSAARERSSFQARARAIGFRGRGEQSFS